MHFSGRGTQTRTLESRRQGPKSPRGLLQHKLSLRQRGGQGREAPTLQSLNAGAPWGPDKGPRHRPPAQLERVGRFSHRLEVQSTPLLKLKHPQGPASAQDAASPPRGPREVPTEEVGDPRPARVYVHMLPVAPARPGHLRCCFYVT